MFCDEGLGAYAVTYIEKNYTFPKNLTVLEGGTLGFRLMEYYQDYDKIIIVTSGSKDNKPGTILHETTDEILEQGPIRKTANEVEITMMIEICSFSENMGEVEIISMTPENIIDVKNALTNTVLINMPKLVDKIVKVLEKDGIKLIPKKNIYSFEKIIQDYANPIQSFR